MKNIKDELQYILIGDGQVGLENKLKKTQNFLRRNAEAIIGIEKQEYLKNKEEISLISFATNEALFFYLTKNFYSK